MDTHHFKLFGHRFEIIVGTTDMHGVHTVTLKCHSDLIPKKLQCHVDPKEEFIEIYQESVSSRKRIGKWVKLETEVKYKMAEYRFAEILGKWMGLTYLTLQHDIWFNDFIPKVNEQAGYKIYKAKVGTNIFAENKNREHTVEFISKPEEDGIRYIAKDNKGMNEEHFSFYTWEFERVCVGIKPD